MKICTMHKEFIILIQFENINCYAVHVYKKNINIEKKIKKQANIGVQNFVPKTRLQYIIYNITTVI